MHMKSRAFTRHRARLSLALALAAPCWLGACKERSAHPPSSKELRTFRIDDPLAESPQQGPFARTPITHYALLERISDTATEPRVSAILLQLGGMGGAWSR